jgi:hypothetical protein
VCVDLCEREREKKRVAFHVLGLALGLALGLVIRVTPLKGCPRLFFSIVSFHCAYAVAIAQ